MPHRRRMRAVMLAMGCAAALYAPPASAVDLDGLGGLDTQTIASRDRLRFYDNSKKFGAERIADRSRGDYQPDGIRIGNYMVFASASERVTYDDNIFGSNTYRRADTISELDTTVRLQSQFARHSLNFSAGAKLVNFARNTELDHIDGNVSASGALHIDHAHTLSVVASSSLEHQLPSDPEAPNDSGRPIEILRNRAAVGLTRDVGRLYGTLATSVESLDYKDTRTRAGAPLDQDSRDTTTWSADLKVGYRFSPGYELVGKVRALRQWNRGTPELDRDAVGYDAVAGLSAEINPLLRWRVLGGWGLRDYDQTTLKSVSTGLFEAQITWLPTQLVTVYVTATRSISDTVDTDAAGRTDTTLKARVEYEMARNVVLSAEGLYRESEFSGLTRQDRTYTGRLGVDYWHSKNLMFTFGYEHMERRSNEDAFDVTRNQVRAGAKLRF